MLAWQREGLRGRRPGGFPARGPGGARNPGGGAAAQAGARVARLFSLVPYGRAPAANTLTSCIFFFFLLQLPGGERTGFGKGVCVCVRWAWVGAGVAGEGWREMAH
jgi:hypothetical protein